MLAEKVKDLLTKHEACRDSDSYLCAMYWKWELGGSLKEMTAYNLLSKLANEEITNAESLRRSRQLWQANNPYLRGRKWEERHKKADIWKQQSQGKPEDFNPQTKLI